MGMKVFKSLRKFLFTCSATLKSFWAYIAYVIARFTSPTQMILSFLVPVEECRGGREKFSTFEALFLRNTWGIIHDLNHLHLVTLLFAAAKAVRCSTLSQGVITPSLGSASKYTFFFAD
jgi:hypothetical protein